MNGPAGTFTHWSAAYVGRAWSPDGEGPHEFSCWGLVRAIVRERHGLELPLVNLDDHIVDGHPRLSRETLAALKDAARAGGWIRVVGAHAVPNDGDIVLMQSVTRTHVGIVASYRRRACVLHSNRGAGVVREEWIDAVSYSVPELWRRAT